MPISSREVERAFLGALLLDSGEIRRAQSQVAPEMFGEARHRVIYQAMLDLGDRADVVTVVERLASLGTLDNLGGATYVAGLPNEATVGAMWPQYAEVVAERYREREYRRLGQELGYLATDENAVRIARAILNIARAGRRDDGMSWAEANEAVLAWQEQAQRSRDETPGVPFFLDPLNVATGGQMAGELIAVSAPTGHGKSVFLDQSFERACRRGPAVLLSNEMGVLDYHLRALARRSGVSIGHLRDPRRMDSREEQAVSRAMGEVAELPGIRTSRTFTFEAFRRKIDHAAERLGPLCWIGLDWAQRLRPIRRHTSRVDDLDEIADALGELAQEYGVPIMFGAQIDKGSALSGTLRAETMRGGLGLPMAAHLIIAIALEEEPNPTGTRNGRLVITKARNAPELEIPVLLRGPVAEFVLDPGPGRSRGA
jgi:replicative DNA helicase